ncbi:MAG: exo-alpha-sialidase [Pigmentiphaga sp.]|nr:exo-alpha-sialidase [Pigmentiphaga sp.]
MNMKLKGFFVLIGLLFTSFLMAEVNEIINSKEFIFDNEAFGQCHASTIAETSNGLIAAWFGGTKEGHQDVEIWISRFENNQWSTPASVANGVQHAAKRYPCWNPVLYQTPDDELILFYNVGATTYTWWGEIKRSSDGGLTWSHAERLPEDIIGPTKNKPFLTKSGQLLSASNTKENTQGGWKLQLEMTSDFGRTWELGTSISDPDSLNAVQGCFLYHDDEYITLQLLARSKNGGVVDSWSYDEGKTWSAIRSTHLPNPNSGIDAITLKEGFHMLVYNPTERPEKKWGGKRTPLCIGVSKDGINWRNIAVLETGDGEYSYPSLIQGKNGLVHITYTWKRKKIVHAVVDPKMIIKNHPSLLR